MVYKTRKYFVKIVFAVILIACILLVSGCKEKEWNYNSETNKAAAQNHIPFTGIEPVAEKPDLPKMTAPYKVIDVSAWQEEVDFKAVSDSGVKGVVIRLARYNSDKDVYFDRNYAEAKKYGLLVGCYYFMGAKTTAEAEAEADKVIDLLNEKKYELELPVFYDVENEHGDESGSISNLDRQVLTDIIKTFCDTLRENNYYSGYYSNISFAKDDYYPEQLNEYPFWLAQWGEINNCQYDFYLWQYSATGQVPGVNGDCDLDLCFADFNTYMRAHGYNNLKK